MLRLMAPVILYKVRGALGGQVVEMHSGVGDVESGIGDGGLT